MEKITLKVDGMSCEHCAKAVRNAVTGSGAADAVVDLKGGSVSFRYDSAKVKLEAIKSAITEEGYTVTG